MLYILDSDKDLIGYNIALGSLSTLASAGVSNVIDCYFDDTKNALIIVKDNFDMKEFSLATMSETDSHSTSFDGFDIDQTGTYAAMFDKDKLDICLIGTPAPIVCPSNCDTCSNPSVCTTCSTNYLLNGSSLCDPVCSSNCDLCSSPSVCTTCAPNYVINALNGCDPVCPSNCLTCTSPTICTTCATAYVLNGVTNLCDQCPSNCNTCTSPTVCSVCAPNYILNASNLCDLNQNSILNSSSVEETTFFQDFIVGLLDNDGISFVNKIPGGRRALPFLCFLVNIDELWLYQYHERNYGDTMNTLFESIQKL